MKYSIQNSFGEVYGVFNMPPSNQSPEVWAAELGDELKDILGINGVREVPLVDSSIGESVDRIVIDIDPYSAEKKMFDEAVRIERVHETVGRLSAQHR